MANKEVVLSVKDLVVHFSTDQGYVQAVRGVSFDLYKGETLCIVGESGSGKSVTSKTIMGILAANGRIVGGSIMYEGEDLTKVSEDEFHRIRGHKIGMIFQDPLSSLNPIMRIGKQITEAMLINNNLLKKRYNDLVASELVAYKNAKTLYKRELNTYKENKKFLLKEKEKELDKIKNEAKNDMAGKLYNLKIEHGNDVVKIKELHSKAVNEIKASKKSEEEIKSLLEKENERYKNELLECNSNYFSDKTRIRFEAKDAQSQVKDRVALTKAEFDARIAENKETNKTNKTALKEKYRPLIKDSKVAYKAKSAEAKKEVKEYASKLKAEHNEKLAEIKANRATFASEEAFKKAIEEENSRYISLTKITKAEAKARALKIMAEVGISTPERRFRQYPFEFSGGMRQRIVIAIALTANPDIIICDEPTTALDVTIQAQILELINRLKKERNMSCIFITHDLGVVANMADRVAVMYAGKIVECGTEEEIFYDPRHPYTWALLASIPDIDSKEKLEAIPGTPPNMIYPPIGDAFALRSKYAMAIDFKKEPPLFKITDTHYAATWLLDPRAPKVEMPKIVKTRIENSLKANKKGGK